AQSHHLQLLQDPARRDPTKNVEIEVAEIINGGDDLNFNSLPTRIGLYTYKPEIVKEKKNNGHRWVIYQKAIDPQKPEPPRRDDQDPDDEITPNPVQDDLKRWLSLQYRLYRIHTDSINRHIDELTRTKTTHNAWSNYFIGKQSYKESSDSYKVLQAGYDYGVSAGAIRHFGGGFFDITKANNTDIAYDGKVSSFGLGGYYEGSYYIGNLSFDFDAKMKYSYNSLTFFGKNGLDGATFIPSYHLFMMGARLGSKIQVSKANNLFIEPSAEAKVGFLNGGYINILDKVVNRNFGATQDSAKISSLRLNMSLAKKHNPSPDLYLDARAKIYYANDSNLGGDITLRDVVSSNNRTYATAGDNRIGIGLEANAALYDALRLYASIERTFFSEYNTTYLMHFGVRLSFFSLDFIKPQTNSITFRDNTRTPSSARRGGTITFVENQRPVPRIKKP
nr:autotransporter outer membrane beta-barrel domain-containing protein [Helicobacter sp.]